MGSFWLEQELISNLRVNFSINILLVSKTFPLFYYWGKRIYQVTESKFYGE